MIKLSKSLAAWGRPDFEDIFKGEVEKMEATQLPLQKGLSTNSYVTDSPHHARIISVADENGSLDVTTGIFYSGITPGCSCADVPTPVEEQNEYCEVQFKINKRTAETVALLAE